jgi:hypothetical protein
VLELNENLSSVQGEVDALLRKFQPTAKLSIADCTTPELRLEYVARWLEAGTPRVGNVVGFDMGLFYRQTECGTVCCIAGAALSFFSDIPLMDLEDMADTARCILGLPDDTKRLFVPHGWNTESHIFTPAWAARCIRKYQREGVVDWEGTR